MSRQARLTGPGFRRARRALGSPAITVVNPLAQWSLPAGYAYDASVDALLDAAGNPVDDPSGYWTTQSVDILPVAPVRSRARSWAPNAEIEVLGAAGLVPAGTADIFILASSIDAVRAAFLVILDGRHYDVVHVSCEPVGATPVLASVRLQRRS